MGISENLCRYNDDSWSYNNRTVKYFTPLQMMTFHLENYALSIFQLNNFSHDGIYGIEQGKVCTKCECE